MWRPRPTPRTQRLRPAPRERADPAQRGVFNALKVYARARFWKELSSAARSPTASAPVRTAASPRLETSTRGGYGSQRERRSRVGSRRRSRVGPDAAAEDDERDVGRPPRPVRGGARSAAPPRRRPVRAIASPARAAAKMLRTSNGGCRVVAAPFSATSRAASSETAAAHGSISSSGRRHQVDLARRAVAAAVQLAPRMSPAPSPVPTERKTKSSTPRATPCQRSPTAARLMSFSTATGEPSRSAMSSPQCRPSRPGTFVASRAGRCPRRRRPGRRRPHRRSARPGARRTRRASLGGRRSPRSRASASAPSSSTSWRARTSPRRSQIAPRRKRAPRSRPRTSAASGTRLEEDGAVGRPARVGLGLLHEPRVEERLQRERDRRLGDAGAPRDLGARDRRAGPDRLEHGALVQVLEQRRDRSGARHRGQSNLTRFAATIPANLTSCSKSSESRSES